MQDAPGRVVTPQTLQSFSDLSASFGEAPPGRGHTHRIGFVLSMRFTVK